MKQVRHTIRILLISLSASPCHAVGWDLQSKTLPRPDGSAIHYYVERGDGEVQQSLLVIMQGSDCNSIARHPTIHEYAEAAPEHAVLLVEKYGITKELSPSVDVDRVDCPVEYLRNDNLEQRVLDYLAVIAVLRAEADWWMGELVILAGSSGVNVAEQVAALVPETQRLVIFGFGSRWLEDDILYGVRASLEAANLEDDARMLEFNSAISTLREIRENPTPNKFASGHSYWGWASLLRFDQLEALARVLVPVLAIQGLQDQNVSPKGAQELIKALHELGRANITYREYDDLDHGFRDSSGKSHKSRVVEDIRRWLQSPRAVNR